MNEKITLQDLVELMSIKHGITKKHADTIVREIFDVIEEALSTERYVKIKGFGTFKLTEVDSRESMNVNTGERIEIQGHTKISFTPDATMKELINKPFSHFETVVLNEGVQLEDISFEEEPELEEMSDEMDGKVLEQPEIVVPEEVVVPEELPVEEPVTQEPLVSEEIPVPVEEPTVEEPLEEVSVEEELAEVPLPVSEEKPMEEPVVEEETVADPVPVSEEPAVEEKPVEIPLSVPEDEPVEEPVVEEPEMAPEPPVVEEPMVEEPVVTEEEKTEPEPVVDTHYQNNRKTFKVLVGIIIVLVLIILFGLYWMFLRSDAAGTQKVESVPVQETVIDISTEEPETKEDTIQVVQETSVEPQPEVQEPTAVLAEDVEYAITGTIATLTLEPGQTLVKLALKYYGSKNFWPYIMQHNPDVIKDADIVPIGATIKMPKLEPKK